MPHILRNDLSRRLRAVLPHRLVVYPVPPRRTLLVAEVLNPFLEFIAQRLQDILGASPFLAQLAILVIGLIAYLHLVEALQRPPAEVQAIFWCLLRGFIKFQLPRPACLKFLKL